MAGSVGDETTQMGALANDGTGDDGSRGRFELLRSTHRDVLVRYATSWSANDPERTADQALIEAYRTLDGTENQRNVRGQLFGMVRDMVGREQGGAGAAAAAAAPTAAPTVVAPPAGPGPSPDVAGAYGPSGYGPAADDTTMAMGSYEQQSAPPPINGGPMAAPGPMLGPDHGLAPDHAPAPGSGPRPVRRPRPESGGIFRSLQSELSSDPKPLIFGVGILLLALLFVVGLLALTGGSDDTATDELTTAASVSTTTIAADDESTSSSVTSEAPVVGPTMQAVGVTPGGTIAGVVGEAVVAPSFAVTGTGEEMLLFSADGLPPGVFIDSTTGIISGTPARACECEVVVRVIDRNGMGDEIQFRWDVTDTSTTTSAPTESTSTTEASTTVTTAASTTTAAPTTSTPTTAAPTTPAPTTAVPGNQAPSIALTWSGYPLENTVSSGAPVEVTFTASDPDGDPLTFSATGLPAGIAIDPGSGTLRGTVAGECTCRVVMIVEDGRGGRATVDFEWIVRP